MKNIKMFLVAGFAACFLAGCATQTASNDSGRVRTAYQSESQDTPAPHVVIDSNSDGSSFAGFGSD